MNYYKILRHSLHPLRREYVRTKWRLGQSFSRLTWVVFRVVPAAAHSPSSSARKQQVVVDYARRFSLPVLVETGTFMGAMVEACRGEFGRIISVELDPGLARKAEARFAPFPHITILQGDSAETLPQVLGGLSERCLFWLDGHFSHGITAKGQVETPILQELAAILTHPVGGHVILIDDARAFTGENDYPTLSGLESFVTQRRGGLVFHVHDDVIAISPASGVSAD